MMPASNVLDGEITAYPDQCIETWVSVAEMKDAGNFSPNVLWTCGNAIFMASVLEVSHGDEVDFYMGYQPTLGTAEFPLGVPKVLVNGIPAITLGCAAISNDGNARQGIVSEPSPTKVFIMLAAGAPAGPAMTRDEISALGEALRGPPGPARGVLFQDIGYHRIEVFSSNLPSRIHGAVAELASRGMKVLILDLRDNPGGEVAAALELAGHFLPPGTLLGTLRDADGDETEYRARPGAYWQFPLVLLVNRRTASAAELFTGCLQAHRRALVRGERTYGKGTVETVAVREDGRLGRVPVAMFLLPDGAEIQGIGVEPLVAGGLPDGGDGER
jgi:carboxyl-terminal processing protease